VRQLKALRIIFGRAFSVSIKPLCKNFSAIAANPLGSRQSVSAKRKTRNLKSKVVPPRWRKDVENILITDAQIARRVKSLAREIEKDFRGREMVVVSLLNGTVMFLADLIRHLNLPLRLDFIGVSSYGVGTESGDLVFTKELRLDVRGRDVLLVDDILDTGKTMRRVLEKLCLLGPRRIKTCVLLNKPARRIEKVKADYTGFEIPDFFVVGYGLDFAERYRNLPFVGVLHPHVYKQACKEICKK
jgi:hypoxanthine phosphoribosyltransferase